MRSLPENEEYDITNTNGTKFLGSALGSHCEQHHAAAIIMSFRSQWSFCSLKMPIEVLIMTTCNFKRLSGALWFAHFFRMTVREGGRLDKVVGSGRASR